MTEYIIQEKIEGNWYLFCLASVGNKFRALEILKERQLEYPEKRLRIKETKKEENWWNTIGTH